MRKALDELKIKKAMGEYIFSGMFHESETKLLTQFFNHCVTE